MHTKTVISYLMKSLGVRYVFPTPLAGYIDQRRLLSMLLAMVNWACTSHYEHTTTGQKGKLLRRYSLIATVPRSPAPAAHHCGSNNLRQCLCCRPSSRNTSISLCALSLSFSHLVLTWLPSSLPLHGDQKPYRFRSDVTPAKFPFFRNRHIHSHSP